MAGKAPRISTGDGRYAIANEIDYTFTTNGPHKPPLIVCHARAATGTSTANDPVMRPAWEELAEYYTVNVSDLGGSTNWGNSTSRLVIDNLRTGSGGANPGGFTKCGIIGVSMGGLAALQYAIANPTLVAFVALLAPAINVNDLRFYNAGTDTNDGVTTGTYNAEINSAYSGTFTNNTTNNPYLNRANYPSTVPTAIWTSPSDTVVRNQWADDLVASKPTITRYLLRTAAGAGYAHTAVIAPGMQGLAGTAYNFPRVIDWCIARRWDVAF